MHVRVVRFSDVSTESMDAVVARVQGADGPPPGVPTTGLKFTFDEDQGTAVVIQSFATAEEMAAGAAALDAMATGETPGTRVSVDSCEVKLERDFN